MGIVLRLYPGLAQGRRLRKRLFFQGVGVQINPVCSNFLTFCRRSIAGHVATEKRNCTMIQRQSLTFCRTQKQSPVVSSKTQRKPEKAGSLPPFASPLNFSPRP